MTSYSGTLLSFDPDFPAMDNVFGNTRARLRRLMWCLLLLLTLVFPGSLLPVDPGFPLSLGSGSLGMLRREHKTPLHPFVFEWLRAQLVSSSVLCVQTEKPTTPVAPLSVGFSFWVILGDSVCREQIPAAGCARGCSSFPETGRISQKQNWSILYVCVCPPLVSTQEGEGKPRSRLRAGSFGSRMSFFLLDFRERKIEVSY